MTRRRGFWLYAVVGLALGACGGDDTSPAGSGGSSVTSGTGGAGGESGSGGAAGSTSGGAAGTGGDAGSGGTSGAGGTSGDHDGGSHDDAMNDAPTTPDGGEAGGCLPSGTTMMVVNEDSSGYVFDGGPLNPVLTLCRGNKYTFVIDAPGHPIYIRQPNGASFTTGVTGNHMSSGELVFDVPRDAPGMLFYQCDIHDVMTGPFVIID